MRGSGPAFTPRPRPSAPSRAGGCSQAQPRPAIRGNAVARWRQGPQSGAELGAAREEILKYFCEQYRMMLEDNLDEHIEHFDHLVLGKDA